MIIKNTLHCIEAQCSEKVFSVLWVDCNMTSLLSIVLCLSDQQPAGSGLDRTAGAQLVPHLPDWWVHANVIVHCSFCIDMCSYIITFYYKPLKWIIFQTHLINLYSYTNQLTDFFFHFVFTVTWVENLMQSSHYKGSWNYDSEHHIWIH